MRKSKKDLRDIEQLWLYLSMDINMSFWLYTSTRTDKSPSVENDMCSKTSWYRGKEKADECEVSESSLDETKARPNSFSLYG